MTASGITLMLQAAIAKAKMRLRKVEIALASIRECHELAEIEPVWSDYLLAHNSIFSILEQGAKDHPRSRYWFGTVKHLRRKDQLLAYLHQARNADEHDIPSIVERSTGSTITFAPQGRGMSITQMSFCPVGGTERIVAEDPRGLNGRPIAVPILVLKTVRDRRYGIDYPPPKEHMGTPFETERPIQVAEAGLAYVTQLISEAEMYVQNIPPQL